MAAQVRAMLPVFWGISGSIKTIFIIPFRAHITAHLLCFCLRRRQLRTRSTRLSVGLPSRASATLLRARFVFFCGTFVSTTFSTLDRESSRAFFVLLHFERICDLSARSVLFFAEHSSLLLFPRSFFVRFFCVCLCASPFSLCPFYSFSNETRKKGVETRLDKPCTNERTFVRDFVKAQAETKYMPRYFSSLKVVGITILCKDER